MIVSAQITSLHLAMRDRVSHSAAEREQGESILVKLEDSDGRSGYGEGCPRGYVTGETLADCLSFFIKIREEIEGEDLSSFTKIDDWLAQKIDLSMPSLRCALEMALLDLLAQRDTLAMADLFLARKGVRYSGVIAASSLEKVAEHAKLCRRMGFSDVKIKVGTDLNTNLQKVEVAREHLGEAVKLRVDANMAWDLAQAEVQIAQLLKAGAWLVEQPLARDAHSDNCRLAYNYPDKILLDESCVHWRELRGYMERGAPLRFLFKVSKNGGPRQLCEMTREAQSAGFSCHLGAHVGESSLLSAAGRVLAATLDFATVEGSFGALLLKEDICAKPLQFGPKGEAEARYSEGLGWGLSLVGVNELSWR